MLESAAATFHRKDTVAVFRQADATNFRATDFGTEGFDRILVSYALSMIPNWQATIDAALAALVPGGSVHIVDFGQQEHLPRVFRRLLQAWLAKFHVTPRADLREALEERLAQADADMVFEEIGRGYAWHAIVRKRP